MLTVANNISALNAQRNLGISQRSLSTNLAHLSSGLRTAFVARFEAGNQRLAQACGFAASALAISPVPPANSIPLETVFSLRTQSVFADLYISDVNMAETRAALSTALSKMFDCSDHPQTRLLAQSCRGLFCQSRALRPASHPRQPETRTETTDHR